MRSKVKEEKPTKEKKLNFLVTWREICRKQKGLMVAMIIMVVMAVVLLMFALITLRPKNNIVIVGYGDVYGEIAGLSGGYRRDNWLNMLAFPILALVFGVLHSLITLRLYQRYGKQTPMVMVGVTMLLIASTFVVIWRLIGEW